MLERHKARVAKIKIERPYLEKPAPPKAQVRYKEPVVVAETQEQEEVELTQVVPSMHTTE